MLPNTGKLLALDLGNRRTGVAVSDKAQSVAFLRDELEHQNTAELLKQLGALIAEDEIVGIVARLPLWMSGEASPQTEKVREQIKRLEEEFGLPVEELDERLTTQEAFAPKMKIVDSRSAQILLENYLTRKSRRTADSDSM